MLIIRTLLVIGMALLFGCGGCGNQPEYCKGLELEASQGRPLDLVRLHMNLEVDEGEEPIVVGQLFAEVTAKGIDGPWFTEVQHDEETGAYTLVVPAHPDGIGGGKVKIKIRGSEGECNGEEKFEILPLSAASGTMAKVVEKMRQVIELQTEKLGYTMADLDTDDITTLPEPLWGIASSIDGIDGADNPNSLVALAANDAEVDVSEGLELANALMAKAGIPGALDAAIAKLEAVEAPDEAPEFEMNQVMRSLSFGLRTRQQALCTDLILRPVINGPYQLSYYMTLADAAASELATGDAATMNNAGTLMGALPHPAFKAAAIVLTTIAFQQKSTMLAYSNTLPSTIINPKVEVSKEWFEEDSTEAGTWKDKYMISATSNGWNATGTVLEGIVQAIDVTIGSKGLVDELTTAIRAGDIAGDLAVLAASNGSKALLADIEGDCAFPPWIWGPLNVSDVIFSEVAYELAIKEQQGNRWGYVPRKTGPGTITLNIVPSAFPPESNVLASLVVQDVDVREIIVTLDPGYGRIEPGGTLEVRAVVRNAMDKNVEFFLITPQDAGAGVVKMDVDVDGNYKAIVTGASQANDYPVRIKAKSIAIGGLRTADAPERADFGTYLAREELRLSPSFACVKTGETEDFTAEVAGSDDTMLDWEAGGGSITGTGLEVTYKATAPGVHTVRASHPGLDVSDEATVVVNKCECEFDVLLNGMVFAQFGGYLNMSATTNGRSLTMVMQDEEGKNLAQIISPAESGLGVDPGQPGIYDAIGTVTLEGAMGVVDSYVTLGGTEEGELGKVIIDTWEDHYMTGRFEGRSFLFYTIAGNPDERVWANITIHFRMFVNEALDFISLSEYGCHLTE